jgi:voltage-gated potassium channel Kch
MLWKAKRFLNDTPSVRTAASVIVAANTAIVFLAALAMRIFDAKEFPSFGRSAWWAVQTVTTVGYGDVTPQRAVGRVIAAVVMLQGVAFIAVITATITSAFVARAEHEYGGQAERWSHIDDRFDELDRRLQALAGSPQSHDVQGTALGLDPDDATREEST